MLSAISLFASFALTAHASALPSVKTEMLVSTEWLAAHLSDPNVVVLCVASDESFYSEGHIPGSRLVLLSEIIAVRESIPNELPSVQILRSVFERVGVTNDSRIVLYGERSGLLAARAYFTLDHLGVADRAALLDGGMEKWRSEQRPESKTVPAVTKSKLDAHVNPSVLVTADELKKMLATPQHNVSLIDARPAAEYTGDRLSEDVSHAGHIPGAAHLFWKDLVVEGDIPVLRPASQLQALFGNAGADHRQTVVSYCRTGMQSSLDYFVAKYLGYTARMYDASFYEWSRKNLPVEVGERH
jgi:thiosulfate/3-mercaptopyruvate sulfurtransferase